MAPCRAHGALFGGARIAGLALLLLPLVLGPAFVLAGLLARWREGSWLDLDNLAAGLICSLVFWLFVAAFHLRRERLVMPLLDHDSYATRARLLLGEMGYEVTSESAEAITARPGFHAMLFGGGVHVALDGREATLLGPRYALERLRNQLRVQGHLCRVHAALHEERRSAEESRLRLELRLRLTPTQLDAVRVHVLAPLTEHAEVVCELNVLARSEAGMPAAAVNALVREGLQRAGVIGTNQAEHVRLHAPSSPCEAAVSA